MQIGDINQAAGTAIAADTRLIAETVTSRHFELKPELQARYGAAGRVKCSEDAAYHLSYLSEALYVSQPALFSDYVLWAKSMLAGRNIPETDLADNLRLLSESLGEHLAAEHHSVAARYVEIALERLADKPAAVETDDSSAPFADLAADYIDALLAGRRDRASRLIHDALESGRAGVKEIYLYVFQNTQHEIGRLWQTNRISVAQEHYATAATQLIMSQLYRHIFSDARNGRTLVATCVSGDLHEIGVRMVSDFFEMEGWDTFYLGANTPTQSILQTVKERNADLLLLSATMTFHVKAVREIIDLVRSDAAGRRVKIMVGGYPFNVAPNLWREIGADGFAQDAPGAVAAANRLTQESQAG